MFSIITNISLTWDIQCPNSLVNLMLPCQIWLPNGSLHAHDDTIDPWCRISVKYTYYAPEMANKDVFTQYQSLTNYATLSKKCYLMCLVAYLIC